MAEEYLRLAASSVLLGFTSSVLMAACLVLERAGVQLFRFLSPNTVRGALCNPIKSFVCFVREVVTVVVAECAFLISAFREVEEDVVVEEDEEECGGGICCRAGSGREVETVVVFEESLGGALLRCAATCFPVDPPPFCDGLCLTTFNSSIWVSAVPCARPKSTSAYILLFLL